MQTEKFNMELSEAKKSYTKRIKQFLKKNNKISHSDIDHSDHGEKKHIEELEFTISEQKKEIKQQQDEIQRLNEKLGSNGADRPAINTLQEDMQYRFDQIKDMKAERARVGHELRLQKYRAYKEAVTVKKNHDKVQKRIEKLEASLTSAAKEKEDLLNKLKDLQVEVTKTRLGGYDLDLKQSSVEDTSPIFCGCKTEAAVKLNNVNTVALLDTGSQISLIKESFYRQHLSNQEIKPVSQDMWVRCADGGKLTYLGYITAPMDLLGASTSRPLLCDMLVIPDSGYTISVPILLGTNVLQPAMDSVRLQFGYRFLKDANIHTPWHLSYICLLLREKECLLKF